MGGALGLAVLSTIADAHTRATLGVSAAQALTDGFGLAFRVGALFCIAGAAAAALLLRSAKRAPAAASVPTQAPAAQAAELDEREPVAA